MHASPVTPKGRQRRTALLAALEQLLRDRPLTAIDVRDLTEQAGVSRSAFYVYFPSKEAAVEALLWEIYDEMVASADRFFRGGAPAYDVLEESLEHVAQLWADHRHLLRAMLAAAAVDPRAAATWESWRTAWVERIAETIASERRLGAAPDGPPAADLAAVLIGMNIDTFSRPGPPPLAALTTVWVTSIYGGS